jgi:predicted nuclease with RNAse H fold
LATNKTKEVILGIDLAGSPKRPTGVCILEGSVVDTVTVLSDQEMLDIAESTQPVLCPIDAPLSLPPGRKSLEDNNGVHLRPCDRELQKMGVRFFPITIGPMRLLTERGLVLKEALNEIGIETVESYPGGAQDLWGIPRKQHDLEGLRQGLRDLGLKGVRDDANDHELDAISCALAGQQFRTGKGMMLGGQSGILMPSPE